MNNEDADGDQAGPSPEVNNEDADGDQVLK